MKLTIQIIVYLSIKLLFLNEGMLFAQIISSEQFEKLIFYTEANQTFQFSKTENYFVILQNSKKCDDCFRDINSFINSHKDSIHANLVVVTYIDSNTLERKRTFAHNKKLMPDFTTYLFQYHNSSTPTLFEICKTNFSPELLVIEKEKYKHISYKDLFNFPTSEFTPEVKALVFNLP